VIEEGVIDPALVVKETVKNAISVVKVLITAKVDISYIDRSSRHE
jgi:chaperonin GroEL (HSP60 family)